MTKKGKILYLVTLVLSLLSVGYLFWWDNWGIHSGYYHDVGILDKGAVIACGLIIVAFIFSLITSYSNRLYLGALIPILLLSAYFGVSRACHGPVIATYTSCDLSLCSELTFYADGSFYLKKSSQICSTTESGKVVVKNDTFYLKSCFYINLNWNTMKRNPGLSYRVIKPVGFSFNFENEFNNKVRLQKN